MSKLDQQMSKSWKKSAAHELKTTTARFLESDLIEILRRSSKEPVGGQYTNERCDLLLPSAYCSSCLLLTAPPDIPLLLLLVQWSLYCSS